MPYNLSKLSKSKDTAKYYAQQTTPHHAGWLPTGRAATGERTTLAWLVGKRRLHLLRPQRGAERHAPLPQRAISRRPAQQARRQGR